MTGHTPGPWHQMSDLPFDIMAGDEPKNYRRVCMVSHDMQGLNRHREEHLANARLIAQAPDILENARIVLEGFGAGVFVRDISGDGQSGWAFKLLPYITALARLEVAVKTALDHPDVKVCVEGEGARG